MTARGLTVRAPAKINLHLGVGAPGPDGFHPLTTVFQAIGLYDDLRVSPAADWQVRVEPASYVEAEGVPAAGENIVDRAAALLAAHHGVSITGTVVIDKAIPIAGGMAGGSADAAAALVALDRLWDLGTPDRELSAIAASLGSDVPFALLGGTAIGIGRGDQVEPVIDQGTWWWVVVPAAVGLSTPEVYRHYDRMFPDADPIPSPAGEVLLAIASRDSARLASVLHNDLEAPAVDLRPELGGLILRGEQAGALRGMVSGSGPTCIFLCESGAHARAVAGELGAAGHDVVLVANGPVAGAHVVELG